GNPYTGDNQFEGLAQGSYTVEFLPLAGYNLPNPATVTDTVNPDETTTIIGVYTLADITGRVVVTVKDDQGNAFAEADYDILLDNAVVHGNLTGDFDEMNQSTGQYSVAARSVAVAGIIYNPSVSLVSGNDSIIAQGDVVEFAITYSEEAQPTTGRVTVNQNGAVGTVELIGPSSETVDTATYTNPNATAGNYMLGAITAPAGYHLDTVTDENGTVLSAPYSQNLNAGSAITYNVNFAQDQQPITGRVTVNQNGAVGTVELILPGPVTETINQAIYDNVSAPVGNYTLGTITAPAGFQLTNVTDGNGGILAFPFAQSLNVSGHITYNVNYTAVANNPVVTVSKAVDFTTRENGQFAKYTITVARSDNVNAGVNVDVVDTISGAGALMGNNGGQLTLVPNSAECDNTQLPNQPVNNGQCGLGLITNPGGMNISLPDSDSYVDIIYRVQVVNAGIPTNQNSAVLNTVNTLDSNGQTATDSATVTIIGPQSTTPSGCTNCGGGGGGGMRMLLGDMELLVEKLVSLNGADYRDASSHDLAVVVPENQTTRLYTKVRITNDNDVSAKNIKFNPFFDAGDSDMTAGEIEHIKGAKLVSGDLMIAKIKAGETVEFSYSVLIHENGQNSNPAFDGVEVVDYGSTLPISQDGLTYVTKGEQFVTYIYAGQIPAAVIKPVRKDSGNDSDVLSIKVSADRAEAHIGETVNYTITLQNVSDIDLTHLMIAHSYPAELDIMNTGGGRDDGRELHFSRAIMRPGESVGLQFSAKVISGTAGQVVRSLTRALVNEFENISPAESYLMITDGKAPAGPDYRLAQTGSGLLISLLLSLLAYLGYGAIQKRRYQALKREALKF
ncbi:hypothetical protein JW752_01595, partial [Candidatus Peregrinibacteria bacterium]|nr:hypothetical protein [Candidatus Peregrinibacteria bacterium]